MSVTTYLYILHELPLELQQLIVLDSLRNIGILEHPNFLRQLIKGFLLKFDLDLKTEGDKLIVCSPTIHNLPPVTLNSDAFYKYSTILTTLPITSFTLQYFESAGPWTNLIKHSNKLIVVLEGSLSSSPYKPYLSRVTCVRVPVISLPVLTLLIDNLPHLKSLEKIEVVVQTDLWYITELQVLATHTPLLIVEFNGPLRLLSEPNYVEKLLNLPNVQMKLNTLATPLDFVPFDLVKNLPCRQLLVCEGADVKTVVEAYMPRITNLHMVNIQYLGVENLRFFSDSVREVVVYSPSVIVDCDFTKLTKLRCFTLALSLGCLINHNISFELPDTVISMSLLLYLGKHDANLDDLYKPIKLPKYLESLTITSNLLNIFKLNQCARLQSLTIESNSGMINPAGAEFTTALARHGILSRTRSRTMTPFISSSKSDLLEQLFIPQGVKDSGIEVTMIFKRQITVLLSAAAATKQETSRIRKELHNTLMKHEQVVKVSNLPSDAMIYRLREPVTLIVYNSEIKYFSRLNDGNLKFEKINKRFSSCAALRKDV